MSQNRKILIKVVKVSVWVLIIASVIALYISLRSDQYSFEYGIIALVLWIIALALNYLLKKRLK